VPSSRLIRTIKNEAPGLVIESAAELTTRRGRGAQSASGFTEWLTARLNSQQPKSGRQGRMSKGRSCGALEGTTPFSPSLTHARPPRRRCLRPRSPSSEPSIMARECWRPSRSAGNCSGGLLGRTADQLLVSAMATLRKVISAGGCRAGTGTLGSTSDFLKCRMALFVGFGRRGHGR